MKRTKMEVEKELMDAYRTHSFVLQYDPDCAPGWRCKIDCPGGQGASVSACVSRELNRAAKHTKIPRAQNG